MTRIIDCSIAFNETLMLPIRVRELSDVVSDFVVVEANKTHTGKIKEIHFLELCKPLREQGVSTVYYLIQDMPDLLVDDMQNRFIAEIFQRNCILRPLSLMSLSDDDIILISDIDEIPTAAAVKEAAGLLNDKRIVVFEQKLRRFFLNNLSNKNFNNAPWLGTVACRYGSLKRLTPQGARIGDPLSPRAAVCSWGYDRSLYDYEARVYDAGWHLSSMGGIDAVNIKLESVAEGGRSSATSIVPQLKQQSHNYTEFRTVNHAGVLEFLHTHEVSLATVYHSDPLTYSQLELPLAVREDIGFYEKLFYFEDAIDAS